MMREGQLEDAIQEYVALYMQQLPFEFWKKPFHEFFGIVEPFGKRLVHPWLLGSDRQQIYQRFLTEQWYPSQLVTE